MPGPLQDIPLSKRLRSHSSSSHRFSWGGSKPRSGTEHRRHGKQRRVCSNGRGAVDADMPDLSSPIAALLQASQHEAGPAATEGRMMLVVDENGLAIEKLDHVAAPSFPRAESPFGSEVCHFELSKVVDDYKLNIKQEVAAEEQAVADAALFWHSKSVAAKKYSSLFSYKVPENYTRPPHPYDAGNVSQVNICPVCEEYTTTRLDRRPGTNDEALRARFKCGLCQEGFDLGIALLDPQGDTGCYDIRR